MKAFVLMNTINEPIVAPPTLWNAQTGRLPYFLCISSNFYICWLCTENIKKEDIEAPCQKNRHIQVFEQMKADWHRIMLAEFRLLNTSTYSHANGPRLRADQLDRESWRSRVPANFLRQLSSPDRHAQLSYALYDLARFEQYESMVLLDLAVWKAVCLLQMPTTCGQHDFYSAQEWIKTGWKACKARQRPSNAMTIVVRAVRPYLS